ncbi:MAG: DUF4377 domain-containing protein [Alistipes sp.]|nr:DUF4377 domain-containing protein [Alistipes sp.]
MKKLFLWFLLPITGLLFFCCNDNKTDNEQDQEVYIYVGPEHHTNHELSWFDVKWTDDGQWEKLYSLIFTDYEPGYFYFIKARKEFIDNPPMDSSSILLHHIETLSKVKE